MTKGQVLEMEQIRAALAELDDLCQAEYGLRLEQLLTDTAPNAAIRMQRLTGIVLKAKFATSGPSPSHSVTGARRSWPWNQVPPEVGGAGAPRELRLLDELRLPGPWNERKPLSGTPEDEVPISWQEFQDDAEHERGLFKILALYVVDKFRGREGKTLREYVEADESRRFETGLDLATLVFDAAVTAPLASLLGLPTLAVGVSLVAVQYGYRKLTDPDEDRMGDGSS